jgi:hypothetical protein
MHFVFCFCFVLFSAHRILGNLAALGVLTPLVSHPCIHVIHTCIYIHTQAESESAEPSDGTEAPLADDEGIVSIPVRDRGDGTYVGGDSILSFFFFDIRRHTIAHEPLVFFVFFVFFVSSPRYEALFRLEAAGRAHVSVRIDAGNGCVIFFIFFELALSFVARGCRLAWWSESGLCGVLLSVH